MKLTGDDKAMIKSAVVIAILGMLVIGAACFNASAATPGDRTPRGAYGAVNVLMDDGGTNVATLVFSTPLITRNAFAIANEGPNKIWCGWNKAVSSTTGFPVAAGASLSVDIVYNGSGDPALYCVTGTAAVNQASPNNTRFLEVR